MDEVDEVTTAGLRLRPMTPADAPELFAILSDPAGWWYDPDRRHADFATTLAFTERAAARWPGDRLSYWTARSLEDDRVVGLGGAQRHRTRTWNLSYRIAAAEQGRGLATELARAAQRAATLIDPDVAFIAWVDAHNAPSRRVAERLGLIDRGARVDANDGQLRLAYSDRPLPDERPDRSAD